MTASTARITTPPATSGIGWLHGTASQVSLPSRLMSPSCRVQSRGVVARLRPRARREFLIGNVVEQVCRDRIVGERLHVLARLQQREIGLRIERRAVLT